MSAAEKASIPAPAGYSKTPLAKKLGLKPGHRVALINEPEHFRDLLGSLPPDVVVTKQLRGARDYVHLFVTRSTELARKLPDVRDVLDVDGFVWVSWPKKTNKGVGPPSDLDGNTVRRLGLESGLVDIKVCAIDETWSALEFVFRTSDREALRQARAKKNQHSLR